MKYIEPIFDIFIRLIGLADKYRYAAVGEQKIIVCNASQGYLLEILSRWFKKENLSSSQSGIIGQLQKKIGTFKVHYRFAGRSYTPYEPPYWYFHYYLKGRIVEGAGNQCTVEYQMVYDRTAKLFFRVLAVMALYAAALILWLIYNEGLSDGLYRYFLLPAAVILLCLGIWRFFFWKHETVEEAEAVLDVFENFLKPYQSDNESNFELMPQKEANQWIFVWYVLIAVMPFIAIYVCVLIVMLLGSL